MSDHYIELRMRLGIHINLHAAENNWSFEDIAKIMEESPASMGKYLSGLHNFRLSEIIDLETRLGIKILNI
jgi:hypothetical protein